MEKRNPRRRVQLDVEVRGLGIETFVAQTRELGAGGMFVMTSQRIPEQTLVVVTLLSEQLSLGARVCYKTADGLGLEFSEVTPQVHTKLLQLLYQLDLAGAPNADRRRAQRMPVTVQVTWQYEGADHPGHITNISVYGALLITNQEVAVGADIVLRRTSSSVASAKARVVRTDEGNIGVTFVDDPSAFFATFTDI
jgi:hypothetical protein